MGLFLLPGNGDLTNPDISWSHSGFKAFRQHLAQAESFSLPKMWGFGTLSGISCGAPSRAGAASHFAARSAGAYSRRRSSSAEQSESGSSTRQRLSPRSSRRTRADKRQESFGSSMRRETVSPLVSAPSAKEKPASFGELKKLQRPVAASGHDVPPNIALVRLSPVIPRSARKCRRAPPGLLHSPASAD